jgi:hypothetical protein
MFGIYMMVADSGYRLIKLGECLVKMGQMEYSGIFNPDNINETGYGFKDICGLAVAYTHHIYAHTFSLFNSIKYNT